MSIQRKLLVWPTISEICHEKEPPPTFVNHHHAKEREKAICLQLSWNLDSFFMCQMGQSIYNPIHFQIPHESDMAYALKWPKERKNEGAEIKTL